MKTGLQGKRTITKDLSRYHRHPKIFVVLHVPGFVVAFIELTLVSKFSESSSYGNCVPHFLFGKKLDEGVGPRLCTQEEDTDDHCTTTRDSQHRHEMASSTKLYCRSLRHFS